MDYYSILAAGLGGAIGGALGALLLKVLRRDAQTAGGQALTLVPALVLATLFSQLGVGEKLRDVVSPPSRMERAVRRHGKSLENNTQVKRRLEGAGDASKAARELSHLGLRRLSSADLATWHQLRARLAEASSVVCAGFWTGRLADAQIQAELEKLDDQGLDDWFRVSMSALQLEAESTTAMPADTGLEALLEQVMAQLPEGERPRMLQAFEAGVGLGEPEACWAMKNIFQTVASLSGAPREAALRSLAAL
jgi:hypothetical protein